MVGNVRRKVNVGRKMNVTGKGTSRNQEKWSGTESADLPVQGTSWRGRVVSYGEETDGSAVPIGESDVVKKYLMSRVLARSIM